MFTGSVRSAVAMEVLEVSLGIWKWLVAEVVGKEDVFMTKHSAQTEV